MLGTIAGISASRTREGVSVSARSTSAIMSASYASPDFEEAGFAAATIETHGPEGRYGGLLYIEKEGFTPILERARLAEKFDVAIMSARECP